MAVPGDEERARPECITLGPRVGRPSRAAPPVRLFVASEPAQARAERVFVWSIERVRDPSRVYEIHLMNGLTGFERRGWTTGFSNYRYAIPHYASANGRALYNDVDQIYLADPAALFDAPMGGHGYLALAPDDPSVMLLDCARMAAVWSLESAQRDSKASLQARAAAAPGLFGRLPAEWHARDREYRPGVTRCLHFTQLHTQPWHPFPERFVYQPHAQGALWHALERSADDAGFQVFRRDAPSELFRRLGPEPSLDRVPQDDLPWFLDEQLARGPDGPIRVPCDPPGGVRRGPDGCHEPRRTTSWWVERFEQAAAAHPGLRWELRLETPGQPERRREGGPAADGSPPRVWVLCDDRPGNSTQSLGLAAALGWPFERKDLRFGPLSALHNRLLGASLRGVDRARSSALEPPWPDLVLAAGRRTAPVAQWIREQSAGRTRLVQLGRKGGDRADLFDLVVTPAYCRLFPHRRRHETHAPLHAVGPQQLEAAAAQWRERLAGAPTPRLAVLVGGSSGQYRIDAAIGRRLGEDAAGWAREHGGSLFATTSRRTGPAATRAFRDAVADVAALVYGPGDPGENPYRGLLACADAFLITVDSESMLAEAAGTGKPILLYPLPLRASFRVLRCFREAVWRRAVAEPASARGSGRPQRGLELWCARAIQNGFVRPTRDLERLHEDLIRRGVARRFGDPAPQQTAPPLREAEEVAARIHRMMGLSADPGASGEGRPQA